MANSEIPCRYIAGNHDWHFEGSGPDIPQPELRRRWIKKLAPLYAGENPDGYSVQAGGVNFVLIDNSANEISKEQLAFFKSELARGMPTILCAHIPLYVRGGSLGFSCGNPNFCAAATRNAQNAKTPPRTVVRHAEFFAGSKRAKLCGKHAVKPHGGFGRKHGEDAPPPQHQAPPECVCPTQKIFFQCDAAALQSRLFMNYEISFPVIAAALYSLSVILVKLATSDEKLSPTSILVFNNVSMWILFMPSLFTEGGVKDFALVWQPLLVGVFFAMGNFATFLCAHKGEVSLMTPIMGLKILAVLLFSRIIIGMELPHTMIAAGIICCAAVFIMGYSKRRISSKKEWITFALALWACTSYAACDVFIQKFSPNFSPLSLLCLCNFVLILSTLPYFGRCWREIRSAGRKNLALGGAAAALMVAESLFMFFALAGRVSAPLCNILYNTRGIMSVVFVFAIGKYVSGLETLTQGTAARRAVGSLMILGAVALVLFA